MNHAHKPESYVLWFAYSPFTVATEPLAIAVAREVLNKHFGPQGVLAAHDAAVATGQRYRSEGKPPEVVVRWLDAIYEAYRAAWSAAGLPAMTTELLDANPQLEECCVMVAETYPEGVEGAEPYGLAT